MTDAICPNGGIPGPLACPIPRCACCEFPLRDELAVILHKLFCDLRCDNSDGPCWTTWRQEADLLMLPVEVALAKAWEQGARNGGRGLLPEMTRAARNPYAMGSANFPNDWPHQNYCTCGFCRSAAMGGGA